jgi:ribulose-5-phosphate 4-epimerase/fuculose-1-phosphate aldolase
LDKTGRKPALENIRNSLKANENPLRNYAKKIDSFVEACHKVADYGLVHCSSGNMSSRLDENLAVISASRTWLAEIKSQQVVICDLQTGQPVNDQIPSVESSFHLGILQARPDVNVVLHFQSPYATAIACGNPRDYDFAIIVEVPFYIGRPAIIDFLAPGSEQLANAVIDAMKHSNMAILRNHGLVTCGKDFEETIQRAVFFEFACQILICQNNPVHLSDTQFDMLSKLTGGI